MSKESILLLIPQRPPFVMIDKLLFSNEHATQSSFRVTADNIFVINGTFSEAGLMENIAQTAAARVGYIAKLENNTAGIGFIGLVKNLEIMGLPIINDNLITEIKVENQIFDVTVITGTVKCNNALVAQCEMKIFINK